MIVTTEDVAAGLVPNVAVIPAGQPDAARVTAELNPVAGVTVTVEEPDDPAVAVAEVEPRVKPGCVTFAPEAPKKIPLRTVLPATGVTLIITCPLMFHKPNWPL